MYPSLRASLKLLVLAGAIAPTVSPQAQSSMKTSGDSGGGIHLGGKGPRPKCAPVLPNGATGPIAKAIWQVSSPGRVNFCVVAGVQGNYIASLGGATGGINSNSSASTQRKVLPSVTNGVSLPISFALLDLRPPVIWDREWDPTQPDEQAALPSDPKARVHHASLKFTIANLLEPLAPKNSANLPNAWCVNDLKWASRPYLVVRLSGAGVRSHNDATEISCSIDFGPAETTSANLQTLIGATAFPATSDSTNPTKTTPTKRATP